MTQHITTAPPVIDTKLSEIQIQRPGGPPFALVNALRTTRGES